MRVVGRGCPIRNAPLSIEAARNPLGKGRKSFRSQFYLAFPIRDALRHELSWTHCRRLSRVADSEARRWYMNEGDNLPIGIVLCADKSDSIVEYTLPEGNDQVFAAKYLPHPPARRSWRMG